MLCTVSLSSFADPIQLGYAAFENKQWRDAYEYWVPEADKGDAKAQFYLSILFTQGLGVKRSEETALTFLMLSAEGGFPPAQYHLGNNYHNGALIEQDSSRAIYWWKRSAEQDFISAQLKMGAIHYLGRGAEIDFDKATEWYRRAAKNGSPLALETLLRLGITDIEQPRAEVLPFSSATSLQQSAVSALTMSLVVDDQPGYFALESQGVVTPIETSFRLQGRSVTEDDAAVVGSVAAIVSQPPINNKPQSASNADGVATADWITRQPDDNFTLQVFSSDKQASAERVARSLKSDLQVTLFPFGRFGYRWYGVLAGSFETLDQAHQAKDVLLENNKLETPWIRRFRNIRKTDESTQ